MKPSGNFFSHLFLSLTAIGSMALGAFVMSALTARPLYAAGQWLQNISLSHKPIKVVEKTIDIGNFSKVNAGYAVEVIYTQGKATGKAIVSAPETWIESVEVTTENDMLTIGCAQGESDVYGKVSVSITSPELENLRMNMAASFTATRPVVFSKPMDIEAYSASTVNFGEIILPSLTIDAESAASVHILSIDAGQINVDASKAASVKIKGLTTPLVKAYASSAAEITLSGRCNQLEHSANSGGEVRRQGLILENLPITPRKK